MLNGGGATSRCRSYHKTPRHCSCSSFVASAGSIGQQRGSPSGWHTDVKLGIHCAVELEVKLLFLPADPWAHGRRGRKNVTRTYTESFTALQVAASTEPWLHYGTCPNEATKSQCLLESNNKSYKHGTTPACSLHFFKPSQNVLPDLTPQLLAAVSSHLDMDFRALRQTYPGQVLDWLNVANPSSLNRSAHKLALS